MNLFKRLTSQLKGNSKLAAALLTKRGDVKNNKLTAKGKKRQALGAAGRAKDRASKNSNHSLSSYKYNPKTNRATLKHGR